MNIRDKYLKFFLYYIYIIVFIGNKLLKKFKALNKNDLFNKKITSNKFKKNINILFNLIKYDQSKSNYVFDYFYKIRFTKKKFSLSYKLYSRSIKKNSQSFYSSIKFNSHKSPLVSIIIPVYKDNFHTALCLKSIQEAKTKISYEVIVVDDSPPNEKITELNLVKNIKLISNKKNLGYLMSSNLGAKKSKAKYICMLNNDTFVLDDWLDNLYESFELFPSAGIVGSMLLNKDFSIQEAGSFIFKNGNGYNFGKNYLINNGQVNFTRKVSYCSAASILIDSKLFKSVNGFSMDYYPAYYEDVDLAFKFLNLNKYVFCNPSSKVIHFGSVTMGQGDSPMKTKLMSKNKKTFLNNWQKIIPKRFTKIDQLYNKNKTIVFFEEHLITPKSDAGSLSIFNFAKMFQSLGYEVIFYFKYYDRTSEDFILLLQHGFQVICESLDLKSIKELRLILKSYYIKPDIFYVARPNFFDKNINILKNLYPNTLIIYDTVDLHFIRMLRENSVLNHSVYTNSSIDKMRKTELRNIQRANFSVIRSKYEVSYLKNKENISDKNLFNLSLLYPSPKKIVSFNKSEGLVFVGNFNHSPNIDAVNYFFDQILPKFTLRLLDINIYIVGKKGRTLFEKKSKFFSNSIHFIDFVDDINSFLIDRRLNIAPLRFGAGIKGKIAQSFVIGLPTISSKVGFEGMSKSYIKNMQANSTDEFVRLIDKFYFEQSIWETCQNSIINYSKIWLLNHNKKVLFNKLKSYSNLTKNVENINVKLL